MIQGGAGAQEGAGRQELLMRYVLRTREGYRSAKIVTAQWWIGECGEWCEGWREWEGGLPSHTSDMPAPCDVIIGFPKLRRKCFLYSDATIDLQPASKR